MKNKNLKVSIRIILLFVLAILLSKVPDLYPDFFGDWLCKGSGTRLEGGYMYEYTGCNYGEGFHDKTWHWGYQHFLYFSMGLSLAGIQIYEIVNILNKKHE